MSAVVGLSIAAKELRAVLRDGGRVQWVGTVPYDDPEDLAAAIARLAADSPKPAHRVRVVLERSVMQLRTLAPVPPLSREAARRYAALEAVRLFRRNGASLVTDARITRLGPGERVLWAAAVDEPLVTAVVRGCEEAGLSIETLGPAADVLPWAVEGGPQAAELTFPNSAGCERLSLVRGTVWRSRLINEPSAASPTWAPPLRELGERAPTLAAAYGASVRSPTLELLPSETRAARNRKAWRRAARASVAGLVLWLAAGAVHVARLGAVAWAADRELRAMGPAVDSAVALRGDLNLAREALATVNEAERTRSRTLVLLGELSAALGDSAFLGALHLSADSTLRLAGYAPQAARVLARLERSGGLASPRFEGPVTRERVGTGAQELDRFAIVARFRRTP